MEKRKNICNWIFSVALIFFVCEILTLPLVLYLTYAGRSESPDHILRLNNNSLTWDSATDVRSDGTAELSLFDAYYRNVNSSDSDRVIAPGTAATDVIRVKNENGAPADYTAYLYEVRSMSDLPVVTAMSSGYGVETGSYATPDKIKDKTIVNVVKGTIADGAVEDFDISWNWEYVVSDEQDLFDTWLGDRSAWNDADNITVGFYIVIESDGSGPIEPDHPGTGDNSMLYALLALIVICGVILIISFIGKRRENEKEQ